YEADTLEEPLAEVEMVGTNDWGGTLRTEPRHPEPLRAEPIRLDSMLPPRREGGVLELDSEEIGPEDIEPEDIEPEEIEQREMQHRGIQQERVGVRESAASFASAAPPEAPGFVETGGFVEAELPAAEPDLL